MAAFWVGNIHPHICPGDFGVGARHTWDEGRRQETSYSCTKHGVRKIAKALIQSLPGVCIFSSLQVYPPWKVICFYTFEQVWCWRSPSGYPWKCHFGKLIFSVFKTLNFLLQVFDIECKYVKMHANQEKLWFVRSPRGGEKQQKSTWYFFIVSEPSEWLGRKCLTRTSTSHWRYFINFRSDVCMLSYKVSSPFVTWFLFRTSRRSTSLPDRIRSLKISRMTSRYCWRRPHWSIFRVTFDLIIDPSYFTLFSDVFHCNTGKAEWNSDTDWCCKWCRGAGSDHGWRWKGTEAERNRYRKTLKHIWHNSGEISNSRFHKFFSPSGALSCWWNLCAGSPWRCADHAWEAEVCLKY